jgi:class 3 adenylate cyclase
MFPCPACGHENQVGAKFCSECGVSLAASAAAPREERKIVTVLFADLVGFTSRAEELDPEDVRALLAPYHVRMRTVLERFGGTVEKFIGDAVVALFGAPLAHEDDPERAVRAALAIREWITEPGQALKLRIGINTGEALIALGARPSEGEGMASGDVVNTAARLQTAAPVNGILVGASTYRATARVIDYAAVQPVSAKGKARPVPAWGALAAHPMIGAGRSDTGFASGLVRAGDGEASRSPLIGRDLELAALVHGIARVRRERMPELVTIIGVPGIGKSRLVAELARAVDETADAVAWLQGRSLPYGEGVTFWALSEMVKAHAGILRDDAPELADEKLHHAVTAAVADLGDAHWVEGHLRPLAGLRDGTGPEGDRRDEAFTAWRRFFEGLAAQRPLVLVFEDLHWADTNLLDFVEDLLGSAHVPIVAVCTARPELLERRPGWAGEEERRGTTLWLSALSDGETEQLIRNVPAASQLTKPQLEQLLVGAGGNPLYAEQYLRMLAERSDANGLALPETVQGIIAARLDVLPVEQKSLLQQAAVIGKVFWLGALLEMSASFRQETEEYLEALERKDYIQRIQVSTVAGEAEYTFQHALLRDVTYSQIPRRPRAEKHLQAAAWIASLGRIEDHAELLAHHYVSAVELRTALGQPVDPGLVESTLTSLRAAGDRASSLNASESAARFYESGLNVAPEGSRERAHFALELGRTKFYLMDERGPAVLFSASRELVACGERDSAGEAEALLAEINMRRGDRPQSDLHLDRAQKLVKGAPPSRSKAYVMRILAVTSMMAGEPTAAMRRARELVAMAGELGVDWLRADALGVVGVCRVESGDEGGLRDLERSVAIAEQANVPRAIFQARFNLASTLWERGLLERGYRMFEGAHDAASRFGLIGHQAMCRGERVSYLYCLGRWTEALANANAFVAEVEAGSPHYAAAPCYFARAHMRLARDDALSALADAERALELARVAKDPQVLYPVLAESAHVFLEVGDRGRAHELAGEFLSFLQGGRPIGFEIVSLHVLAWTLTALGRAQELLDSLPSLDVPWVDAARAFATGDLPRAADVCARIGARGEEAHDRLRQAEALIGRARREEAETERQAALAFYRSVGATRYVREAERLLTSG